MKHDTIRKPYRELAPAARRRQAAAPDFALNFYIIPGFPTANKAIKHGRGHEA